MIKSISFPSLVGRLLLAIIATAIVPAADELARTERQIKERTQAVYPYDLAIQGAEGKVEMQFNVDPDGMARDIVVVSASEPAFGFAAKAMLEAWQFEPAAENGQPAWAMQQVLKVRFDSVSKDTALDASAQWLLGELKQERPDIAKAGALDAVPWAVKMAKPVYPRDLLKGNGVSGEATIDFLVDRNGRVQLPRIVSSTQWEFGWAAATAILRFQFTPPTRGGQPVATRMRMPFVFHAPAKPMEDTAR